MDFDSHLAEFKRLGMLIIQDLHAKKEAVLVVQAEMDKTKALIANQRMKAMNLNSEAQQTDILEMEMYLLTVIEQYNRAKAAYNPLRQACDEMLNEMATSIAALPILEGEKNI